MLPLLTLFHWLCDTSVYRPELAAIAGLVRVLGFIAYVRGYSTGDPKKRMQGSFGTCCLQLKRSSDADRSDTSLTRVLGSG